MTKHILYVLTAFIVCTSFEKPNETITFIKDDVRTAIDKAADEGKLIFLEFHADYCTPCKLMDQYTYTAPAVAEQMNRSYVPVKVDIESFAGFNLKQQFKIEFVPTLIVLDSKGRQLAKYEKGLTASQMEKVLTSYDLPENRQKIASNPVAAAKPADVPMLPVLTEARPTAYNTRPSVSGKVASAPISPVVAENAPVAPTTTPATKPAAPSAPTGALQKQPLPGGFAVQAGAFVNRTGAEITAYEVKDKVGDARVYFHPGENADGKKLYRVLVGEFNSRPEADIFNKKMKVGGFVRDLSTLRK